MLLKGHVCDNLHKKLLEREISVRKLELESCPHASPGKMPVRKLESRERWDKIGLLPKTDGNAPDRPANKSRRP